MEKRDHVYATTESILRLSVGRSAQKVNELFIKSLRKNDDTQNNHSLRLGLILRQYCKISSGMKRVKQPPSPLPVKNETN